MRAQTTRRSQRGAAACLVAVLLYWSAVPQADCLGGQEQRSSDIWEEAIRQFEQQDREHPPPTGGIVFVGSSSIRLWNLDRSFPGLPVINRGFGGSQFADAAHFADRIILRYKPRGVVVYSGDNDIALGKSAQAVADDARKLASLIREELPEAHVLFIAIKPSLARAAQWNKMREANRRIAAHCQEDRQLHLIDIAGPMLEADGKPRPDLFVEDGLHLNEAGYGLWARLVRSKLAELGLMETGER